MKPKLITDIRSTNKRGWVEHTTQLKKLNEWIAANLPDTVSFNDCAAFATDEDYILFKMKWSKTCDWCEKAYETTSYEDGVYTTHTRVGAASISLRGVSAIKAAAAAAQSASAAVVSIDPAANAISPIVVTRI